MYKYLILTTLLLAGCKINFQEDRPEPVRPDPVKPQPVIRDINPAEMSEALARLAERCGKSDIRKATAELNGTLNELVADGISTTYVESVRTAVPAIGKNPPRDLTTEEIATLKGIK